MSTTYSSIVEIGEKVFKSDLLYPSREEYDLMMNYGKAESDEVELFLDVDDPLFQASLNYPMRLGVNYSTPLVCLLASWADKDQDVFLLLFALVKYLIIKEGASYAGLGLVLSNLNFNLPDVTELQKLLKDQKLLSTLHKNDCWSV